MNDEVALVGIGMTGQVPRVEWHEDKARRAGVLSAQGSGPGLRTPAAGSQGPAAVPGRMRRPAKHQTRPALRTRNVTLGNARPRQRSSSKSVACPKPSFSGVPHLIGAGTAHITAMEHILGLFRPRHPQSRRRPDSPPRRAVAGSWPHCLAARPQVRFRLGKNFARTARKTHNPLFCNHLQQIARPVTPKSMSSFFQFHRNTGKEYLTSCCPVKTSPPICCENVWR